jgi:hypothetical protein
MIEQCVRVCAKGRAETPWTHRFSHCIATYPYPARTKFHANRRFLFGDLKPTSKTAILSCNNNNSSTSHNNTSSYKRCRDTFL